MNLFLAASPVQDEVVSSQTVWEFLSAGGFIMIPLAVCSVLVVALALERWLYLDRRRVVPDGLGEAIALLAEQRFDEAIARSEKLAAPGGRILIAGIRRRHHGLEDIERAMEDQGRRELERMRSNIRPLHVIANIAPLLGLLGTVVGIQDAFAVVVKAGMGKPENLAGGIEEALVTTIAGLVVAIPSLLLATHLNGRVRRLMLEADEVLMPAVDHIAAAKGTSHAA